MFIVPLHSSELNQQGQYHQQVVDGKSDVVMAHNINGREERHVFRRMSLKFFLFNMHQYQEDRIPGGTNRVIEIWEVRCE